MMKANVYYQGTVEVSINKCNIIFSQYNTLNKYTDNILKLNNI